MALKIASQNIIKSALSDLIKGCGDKSHRWLSNDLAKELFDIIKKTTPNDDDFKLAEGFNPKKGTAEYLANEDQKNAILDAWSELRYEAKQQLRASGSDKEPRLNNYSQISGYVLNSSGGEAPEAKTRAARGDGQKSEDEVINMIRYYGASADNFKEFWRSIKFTHAWYLSKNRENDFNAAMKSALDWGKGHVNDLSDKEKFIRTLRPMSLRETVKTRELDARNKKLNDEDLIKWEKEGTSDQDDEEEQAPDSSEGEQEEEAMTLEDVMSEQEDLKEEKKTATKARKKEIELRMAELDELQMKFEELEKPLVSVPEPHQYLLMGFSFGLIRKENHATKTSSLAPYHTLPHHTSAIFAGRSQV